MGVLYPARRAASAADPDNRGERNVGGEASGERIVVRESRGKGVGGDRKAPKRSSRQESSGEEDEYYAQKPFVETLRVGIPPGKAGTSSRKRVLRAVVGDHHHEA